MRPIVDSQVRLSSNFRDGHGGGAYDVRSNGGEPMSRRICAICKVEKPATDQHFGKDGRHSYCRPCERTRSWIERHLVRMQETSGCGSHLEMVAASQVVTPNRRLCATTPQNGFERTRQVWDPLAYLLRDSSEHRNPFRPGNKVVMLDCSRQAGRKFHQRRLVDDQ